MHEDIMMSVKLGRKMIPAADICTKKVQLICCLGSSWASWRCSANFTQEAVRRGTS